MTVELDAERALQAHAAMRRTFRRRDGLYRRDGRPRLPWSPAHVWPFARALIATLDVAGMPAALRRGFEADAEIADQLRALERYWSPDRPLPAYSSDPIGARVGGDLYYDDNAWIGLAFVELERLRPGSGRLQRAAELLRFAVAGWDQRPGVPSPGGVFWVEQGRGVGLRNHDRNTVSNAPNAQLGLHLSQLTSLPPAGPVGPDQMIAWVNATLDAGANEGGEPGTGLFWDKVRGDGTIDRALWSYNQGNMIGANVLLARRDGPGAGDRYLARAAAIAAKALRHYRGAYDRQPAAFNAILFRNLLLLHAASDDAELRRQILAAVRDYGDWAWRQRRDRSGRFRLSGGGPTLLDQSAIVTVFALLAWDPSDYGKLA